MAHVKIHFGHDSASVTLNGVDITEHILGGSLSVELVDFPGKSSLVHLSLLADDLDLDIVDAVVENVKPDEPRRLCETGESA